MLSLLFNILNSTQQNNIELTTPLNGATMLDTFTNITSPFFNKKSSPDNLANQVNTGANIEAVIMIMNSEGIIKHISNKFFLNSMQIALKEKVQLMETFGSSNITFFGETARVYSFGASTIDSPSQDSGVARGKYYYQSSILKMYNDVLRGSQLIKEKNIAILRVSNHIIKGYPLNLSVIYNTSSDPVTQFVLNFVVSEHTLSLPGVVSEDYLESMYSTAGYINDERVSSFLKNIDKIIVAINDAINNKNGTLLVLHKMSYSTANSYDSKYKQNYIRGLENNVKTVQSLIKAATGDDISPLVESKVPANLFDNIIAIIPSMFDTENAFYTVVGLLKSLEELKNELIIFKSYRIK